MTQALFITNGPRISLQKQNYYVYLATVYGPKFTDFV